MDIANFPTLSTEEFEEACHHLDSKYRQAKLGLQRMRWKLKVRTPLDCQMRHDSMPRSHIEITRALDEPEEDLGFDMNGLALSEQNGAEDMGMDSNHEMMEHEASDEAALQKPAVRRDCGYAIYDILLHPTYRVPCLWFRLEGLPNGHSRHDLDAVFRYLVPDAYKESLRSFNGIGGISMDDHPIYNAPCLFIHPCLTAESMSAFECSRENYLQIWIGLTGACVGLALPKEMMMQ